MCSLILCLFSPYVLSLRIFSLLPVFSIGVLPYVFNRRSRRVCDTPFPPRDRRPSSVYSIGVRLLCIRSASVSCVTRPPAHPRTHASHRFSRLLPNKPLILKSKPLYGVQMSLFHVEVSSPKMKTVRLISHISFHQLKYLISHVLRQYLLPSVTGPTVIPHVLWHQTSSLMFNGAHQPTHRLIVREHRISQSHPNLKTLSRVCLRR